MHRVLIIEDDINLSDVSERILLENGYDVDVAHDGESGNELANSGNYDVILLDIMLPGMSGFDICENLRSNGITTPIIIVSALGAMDDKLSGFSYGADDYMTKPFSPDELLARIKVALRRSGSIGIDSEVSYGDISYDPVVGEITKDDEHVLLSEKEKTLMTALMSNPGQIKTKKELLSLGWDDDDESKNNVEAYISFIRKKLDFIGAKTRIETIRKTGYRMEK